MELAGRVAVVTGASSGIGAATAQALAAEGMAVVAVARRAARLEALAGAHRGVHPFAADVTDDAAVAALSGWVADEFGACHVLVNCAGGNFGGRLRTREDAEKAARTVDVNFGGTLRCTAALSELLFASSPSRVVNVASVAGKLALAPPGYAASKFAVVGFTEALAAQWRSHGVTVSQVNPGWAPTEGFPQHGLRSSALGRAVLVSADDVAAAIVDTVRRGTPERTVPRWFRGFVVLRHLCGPAYRLAGRLT